MPKQERMKYLHLDLFSLCWRSLFTHGQTICNYYQLKPFMKCNSCQATLQHWQSRIWDKHYQNGNLLITVTKLITEIKAKVRRAFSNLYFCLKSEYTCKACQAHHNTDLSLIHRLHTTTAQDCAPWYSVMQSPINVMTFLKNFLSHYLRLRIRGIKRVHLLACLFSHLWWRQYVPPKYRETTTRLHRTLWSIK
jgi:hypothetical protein